MISLGIDPAALTDPAGQPAIEVILPPARPMPTTTTAPPPPPTTTTPPPPPPPPAPLVPSDEALYQLRVCESSNNYGAVSYGGSYRGAYQFDQSTWDGVASRHFPRLVGVDPAAAAPADQDAMARALYRERGAQPWPHCGKYL